MAFARWQCLPLLFLVGLAFISQAQTQFWQQQQQESHDESSVVLKHDSRHLQQRPLISSSNDAPSKRFPYMVMILDGSGNQTCGGVLIDPYWVVTAARCIDPESKATNTPAGFNPKLIIGAFTIGDTKDDNTEVTEGCATLHPGWNGDPRNGYDLAMIKLSKPSKLTPIYLAASGAKYVDLQKFIGIGFGSRGEGLQKPDVLQSGALRFRSNEKCNRQHVWNGTIFSNMGCMGAATRDMRQACEGDYGGPVILAHRPSGNLEKGNPRADVLVAVMSFGQDPACRSTSSLAKPTVVTMIHPFREWMSRIMKCSKRRSNPPPSPPVPGPTVVSPSPRTPVPRPTVVSPSQRTPQPGPIVTSPSPPTPGPGPTVVSPSTSPTTRPQLCLPKTKELNQVLFDSANSGELRAVKRSASCGADLNYRGIFGWTPIMVASQNGHLRVVKFLISKGASLNLIARLSGNTALLFAARGGHVKTVQALLKGGANKSVRNRNRKTAKDLICTDEKSKCTALDKNILRRILK